MPFTLFQLLELKRSELASSDHVSGVKSLIEGASKRQGGPGYFIHIGGTVRSATIFRVMRNLLNALIRELFRRLQTVLANRLRRSTAISEMFARLPL
jgi:hypothetical protein